MSGYRLAYVAAIGVFFSLGMFLGWRIGTGGASSGAQKPAAIAGDAETPESTPDRPTPSPATPAPSATVDVVDDPIAGLPLEVKIGQMIMTGFVSEGEAVSFIVNYHVGNVVLFGPNVSIPSETRRLTDALQSEAAAQNEGLPMLVAIDQEGGQVTRLTQAYGYTESFSARVFGCLGAPELTRRAAKVLGEEMRAVGINMNLAPVLDVNDNPNNPVIGDRSFWTEPDRVATQGVAFIAGLHDAGVAATGKHFPGHGNTSLDSHLVLPTVWKTREQLFSTELWPFRQVIELGEPDAIMVAHVLYPELDQQNPASLSEPIIAGLLRDELGFQSGVVMTDALDMGAITAGWDVGQAAVLAVLAGTDILTFRDSSLIDVVYNALLAAVREGRISLERIDMSVSRILAVKRERGFGPGWAGDPATVGSAEHRQALDEVAEAARDAGCL